MADDRVAVRPIHSAPFGAEVLLNEGVDGLDDASASALRAALAEHHLLLLHLDLDDAAQRRLVSCFGRLLPQGPRVAVNDRPTGPFPVVSYVSNVRPGGGLGTFELSFHHDLAHVPTPLAGLSLYAVDVAPGQAATRFANGCLAYDGLTDAEQAELAGLQSMFIGNYTTTTTVVEESRAAMRRLDPTWPRVVHPVVIPHPVTGRPCVYVNEMQTVEILGLDDERSDAMLDRLMSLLYDPANVYDHEWHNGDLVVWDNLVVQHARRKVGDEEPRTLRRVVFGEKTPWEHWPWTTEAYEPTQLDQNLVAPARG